MITVIRDGEKIDSNKVMANVKYDLTLMFSTGFSIKL